VVEHDSANKPYIRREGKKSPRVRVGLVLHLHDFNHVEVDRRGRMVDGKNRIHNSLWSGG
jgi:hypothetical protein